jgi:hypothetical protein
VVPTSGRPGSDPPCAPAAGSLLAFGMRGTRAGGHGRLHGCYSDGGDGYVC